MLIFYEQRFTVRKSAIKYLSEQKSALDISAQIIYNKEVDRKKSHKLRQLKKRSKNYVYNRS